MAALGIQGRPGPAFGARLGLGDRARYAHDDPDSPVATRPRQLIVSKLVVRAADWPARPESSDPAWIADRVGKVIFAHRLDVC